MLKEIHIHISNHQSSIPICTAAIKEYSIQIGFKRRDVHKIVLVVEEVLGQIIKCFYIDGQEDKMIVNLEHFEKGLRIRIQDHGIPVDADKIQYCDDQDKQGFGTARQILNKYMDEVSYEAKGFAGNEIIFEKHLHSKKGKSIKKVNMAEESEADNELPHEINVRLLKEEEANSISKLAYIAYHYSYPYEIIYIPKKIKEKLRNNNLISAVAVLENEEKIISHTALVLSGSHSKTAEIGIAFTDPHYRGAGCMNQLWSYLIDEVASEMKLFGVFAMAVCSHPYSQKACHKMGLMDSALLLSRAPIIDFEDIDVKEQQRESIMITFRVLNSPKEVNFYLPKHHKSMILDIANHLGLDINVRKHPLFHHESSHNYSNIETSRDTTFKTANMVVNHIGKDIKIVFESEFHALKIARYESIYLFLDLADYHTEKYCAYFEKQGFFFAGIMHQENRMNLVLQYLNNQDYHFENIIIASDFGQKLRDYVQKEYLHNGF